MLELIWARTVPTPVMPRPGSPNNIQIEKKSIEVDADLQGVVVNQSINLPDHQAFFDAVQAT